MRRFSKPTLVALLVVLFTLALPVFGQEAKSGTPEGPIQDNSFLVEEAYNQEPGVVQHINFLMRRVESHDWMYSFTQEYPVRGQKNQLSYTVPGAHAGDFAGSGLGFGDTLLNYRYQLVGSGETRVAVAPRISLILPTGDSKFGRGYGGTGLQTNFASSIVLSKRFVTHLNAGATWVPHAKNELNQSAGVAGYNLGHSLIWLANPRFNVMLETAYAEMEGVAGPGKTEWKKDLLISPGVRLAYNFSNGLQIVPGVAVPIGAGPSSGEKGVIFYLSFEHPWRLIGKPAK